MIDTIEPKLKQSRGLKQFEEFIFIGKTSTKLSEATAERVHLSPNSNFLSAASRGNSLLITQIHTAKNITRQLQNLQLKPGTIVKLISKTKSGSVVVSLDRKLIGIGAEIAPKIIVTLVS